MAKHDPDCPARRKVEPLDERDPCQCKLIKKIRSQYKDHVTIEYGRCSICNGPILVAIFRGTEWCSETCRKILQKET